MKIIKQPELPHYWWVGETATCDSCAAIVQLEAMDTEPRRHESGKHFVECPVCQHRAFLNK
jgi:hypothetical protein